MGEKHLNNVLCGVGPKLMFSQSVLSTAASAIRLSKLTRCVRRFRPDSVRRTEKDRLGLNAATAVEAGGKGKAVGVRSATGRLDRCSLLCGDIAPGIS